MADAKPFSAIELFGGEPKEIAEEVAAEEVEFFDQVMTTGDELMTSGASDADVADFIASLDPQAFNEMIRNDPVRARHVIAEARKLGREVAGA